MDLAKFSRKTFSVDAVRLTATNMDAVAMWCNQRVEVDLDDVRYIRIKYLDRHARRPKRAVPGDWIVLDSIGFKIYPDDHFHRVFEPKPSEVDMLYANALEKIRGLGLTIMTPNQLREALKVDE